MPNAGRAALLAALTVIVFACCLVLLSLLVRCATGDEAPALTPEAPVTTPEVPEGCSPCTGSMARSPRPGATVDPLRPAPGKVVSRGPLPTAPVVIGALPQGEEISQVPAEHPQSRMRQARDSMLGV